MSNLSIHRTKTGNILVPLLAGALIVALTAAGFFFWQSQQARTPSGIDYVPNENSYLKPNRKTESTASWKTFTNIAWNYSFQYPENFDVQGLNMGLPPENLEVLVADPKIQANEATNPGYPFLRVIVRNNTSVPLAAYASSSFEGNKSPGIIGKYLAGLTPGFQYTFSGRNFNTTNSEGQTDDGSGFVIYYPKKVKVTFFENSGNIYTLVSSDEPVFNQILSTFKFTSPQTQTSCGGWDTSGEIVCQCAGTLTKSSCPTNAACDSGSYTCSGSCGQCCYKGAANNPNYPKC